MNNKEEVRDNRQSLVSFILDDTMIIYNYVILHICMLKKSYWKDRVNLIKRLFVMVTLTTQMSQKIKKKNHYFSFVNKMCMMMNKVG